MTDRIFINGLVLHAYHGVMAHEAKVGQTFTIDLELAIDLSAAAHSDKVADTVSYDKVVECASRAFGARRFRLIEAAAGGCRRRASNFSARAFGAHHDPQAARANCRHL
jgi:dihydroneopterin aldolase